MRGWGINKRLIPYFILTPFRAACYIPVWIYIYKKWWCTSHSTAVWVVNMDSKVCQNSWNKSLLVLNWLLFCTVNKSFSTGSFSMLFFFCTWMAKISPVSEQNFFASFSSHCQRRLEPAWLSDEWCNCAVTSAAGAYAETLSVPLQKSHFLCYEVCRRFFLPRCPYRTKLLTPFFMSAIYCSFWTRIVVPLLPSSSHV